MGFSDTMKNCSCFIFDMDGTLIDTISAWNEIYMKTFSLCGKKMPEDYPEKVNHMSISEGAEYTEHQYEIGMTAREISDFWDSEAYKLYSERAEFIPYARELIGMLYDSGKTICIATALSNQFAENCLKHLSADKYVSSVSSVEDCGKSKEYPDVYLDSAKKSGFCPNDCVVIDDSVPGIKAASSAGFHTILISSDNCIEEAEEVIKSLKELM